MGFWYEVDDINDCCEDEEEDDEEDDDEDDYISFSGSEEKPKTPQKSSKGTRILSFEDFVDGLDED